MFDSYRFAGHDDPDDFGYEDDNLDVQAEVTEFGTDDDDEATTPHSTTEHSHVGDLTAKLKSVVPAQPIWRGRKFDLDNLLCFALLPFQETFLEVYESAIVPAAQELGLRAQHAGEIFGNREVVEDIWDSICSARIVVVDVTDRNPNVFYELGICHTLGKECVVITRNKQDVPFDIRHRRFVEYTPEKLTNLRVSLRKTMQAVLSTKSSS